jgi:microsomal prostaglandin-E synthase 2
MTPLFSSPTIYHVIYSRTKEYRKVPIAMLDDQQLNGSDQIVEGLLKHPRILKHPMERRNHHDGPRIFQWRIGNPVDAFAKQDLTPLLYPNMYNTLGNSYRAFGYVHGVDSFSTTQKMLIQTIGSFAMYMAASKIKSKYRNGTIDDKKWRLCRTLSDRLD